MYTKSRENHSFAYTPTRLNAKNKTEEVNESITIIKEHCQNETQDLYECC